MVAAVVCAYLIERLQCSGFGVGGTENHSFHPSMEDGAGAHQTGFQRDIKSRTGQAVVACQGGGPAEHQDLGMGRGVAGGYGAITGFCQEGLLPDKHGAHRYFTGPGCQYCLPQGFFHPERVVLVCHIIKGFNYNMTVCPAIVRRLFAILSVLAYKFSRSITKKKHNLLSCNGNMYTILMYEPHNQGGRINPALFGQSNLIFKSEARDFQVELDKRQFDLIFLELDAGSGLNMELLEYAHKKNPYTPIIITSASERADIVVQAMNMGASDFLVHPLSETRLSVAMQKAIESKEQKFEIDYHRRKQDVVYDFRDVIAYSKSMSDVLVSLEKFAQTDSTILITGETGTGKSFLSGTVHFNSPRKKKPFVKINCANIPEALLESELFGHEKGAFTGADKQRVGRFEQAGGGTIFLDEEKAFERVGGNKTINVDVRVIAATNKNLTSQIEKGLFREDLYYRINVLPVRLPPLRERDLCIVPLANVLLKKYCQSTRRDIKGFHPEALADIQAYDWPGNIRQLANTIERAVILTEGRLISAEHLLLPGHRVLEAQPAFSSSSATTGNIEVEQRQIDISLATQERELVLRVLEECLWVQKNAAAKLGISPRALNYKIRKLGITHPHWRRNK